jgi:ketosteroid isomerase-like protein
MSQENIEVVRQVFDAVAHRDAEKVLALYHPNVELDASHTEFAPLFGTPVFRGHEGLRSFDREWREAFEDVETECEELIEVGDYVVSYSKYHARGRASGIQVSGLARGGVWTVRDGKVTRVVWFNTPEAALAAAGAPRRGARPMADLDLSDEGTSENAELVRKAFDAFNSGDPSFFLEHYDPDIVLRIWPPNINSGTYHGAEAVERQYSQYFGAFGTTFRVEIQKLIEIGDSVLTTSKTTGRGRRSGVPVQSLSVFWIATIRAGKIIRIDEPATLEEACAILGLSEKDVR